MRHIFQIRLLRLSPKKTFTVINIPKNNQICDLDTPNESLTMSAHNVLISTTPNTASLKRNFLYSSIRNRNTSDPKPPPSPSDRTSASYKLKQKFMESPSAPAATNDKMPVIEPTQEIATVTESPKTLHGTVISTDSNHGKSPVVLPPGFAAIRDKTPTPGIVTTKSQRDLYEKTTSTAANPANKTSSTDSNPETALSMDSNRGKPPALLSSETVATIDKTLTQRQSPKSRDLNGLNSSTDSHPVKTPSMDSNHGKSPGTLPPKSTTAMDKTVSQEQPPKPNGTTSSTDSNRDNNTPSRDSNPGKPPGTLPPKPITAMDKTLTQRQSPKRHGTTTSTVLNSGNKTPSTDSNHGKPPGTVSTPTMDKSPTKEQSPRYLNGTTSNTDTIPEKPTPPLKPDSYVGLANLSNQVYRKAIRKDFDFTLMVVGESGLGKSTLINSLFMADIHGPSERRLRKTVELETTHVLLNNSTITINLTLVDTPGFGDAIDNSHCWDPALEYIEGKYRAFLEAESRVSRELPIPDSRVHCCLYFIPPTGHGLRPLDVEFMRRLCGVVNIIPVISKADTLTRDECAVFKDRLRAQFVEHELQIYQFPDIVGMEAGNQAKVRELRTRVPFAVIGSNAVVKGVRGRCYPWGFVDVESEQHCDLKALKTMLLGSHLVDLKDVMHNVHYENYRGRTLARIWTNEKSLVVSNRNPLVEMCEAYEGKRREMERELARECEVSRRELEGEVRELEKRRREFEREKAEWEKENHVTMEEIYRRTCDPIKAKNYKKEKMIRNRF